MSMMNQRQLFRFLRNEQMRGCGNGGWAAFRRFFRFRLTKGSDCDIIAMLSGCGAVGSALPWGGRGRPFKSGHSDHAGSARSERLPCFAAWEFFAFLCPADAAQAGGFCNNRASKQSALAEQCRALFVCPQHMRKTVLQAVP